jgi:hypothetical protein
MIEVDNAIAQLSLENAQRLLTEKGCGQDPSWIKLATSDDHDDGLLRSAKLSDYAEAALSASCGPFSHKTFHKSEYLYE